MPGLSLAGVRVLDVTASDSGEAACDELARLGASVVRIAIRPIPPGMSAQQELIRIDGTVPEGEGLIRDLAGAADVVIADRSSHAALDGARVDAIVVSVTPFGASGPWSEFTADGFSALAVGGLSGLTGPRDGMPTPLPAGAGPAGPLVALAVVAALDERRKLGTGRRIEVSEAEAAMQGLWTASLDYTVNGRETPRLGARDVETAPHGVYLCKDGNWLAIACFSDEEWFSLKVALGRPDWCELERMQTRESRLNEQQEIDRHISHWIGEQTRRPDEPAVLVITMLENLEVPRYTSYELARYFQSYGVPAAVVEHPGAARSGRDLGAAGVAWSSDAALRSLIDDPRLIARLRTTGVIG